MQQNTVAVVVAAGSSRRMGFDKSFTPLAGRPLLWHTLSAFATHAAVVGLVVVAGQNLPQVQVLLQQMAPAVPWCVVPGGATRAESVAAGAKAGVQLCPNAEYVAIHDGARPFVTGELIGRVVAAAAETGAAAPALPVKETIKRVDGGLVQKTVPREELWAMQTPQVFRREAYLRALQAIPKEEYEQITDDCMVMEKVGIPVRIVEGEEQNRKITTPADLPAQPALRVGHGYDVHRLVQGRPLILGGVTIPFEKGLLGHSDADVLLHAVADALLGAAALGDIGTHFPDSDAAYKNADSLELLRRCAALAAATGLMAVNVDATVVCQAPKLAGYIPAMRDNIAAALGLGTNAVNVKATTEEHLGFTGEGQGIAAHCVLLAQGGRVQGMSSKR